MPLGFGILVQGPRGGDYIVSCQGYVKAIFGGFLLGARPEDATLEASNATAAKFSCPNLKTGAVNLKVTFPLCYTISQWGI